MKCKYWKKCKKYNLVGSTCNKHDGWYGNKETNCKKEMEEKDEKAKSRRKS